MGSSLDRYCLPVSRYIIVHVMCSSRTCFNLAFKSCCCLLLPLVSCVLYSGLYAFFCLVGSCWLMFPSANGMLVHCVWILHSTLYRNALRMMTWTKLYLFRPVSMCWIINLFFSSASRFLPPIDPLFEQETAMLMPSTLNPSAMDFNNSWLYTP